MIAPIIKLKELIAIHNITSHYKHTQLKVTITTYVVCGILLLFSLAVALRTCFLPEKCRLFSILFLLIIGYLAGISGSFCIQEFFAIGSQRNIIFNKLAQEKL